MNYYFHQRQSSSKSRPWLKIIGGGILTLIGLFLIFYFSPVFKLTQVKITGSHTLAESTIQSFVQENFVYRGSHSLLLPLSPLEKKIQKHFPVLDKVKVKRRFPHTLIINLKERSPFLKISSQKATFYTDCSGFLFSTNPSEKSLLQLEIAQSSLPVLKEGTFILPSKIWERLYQILTYFKERQKTLPFSRAQLLSSQQLNVILEAGPVIYFSLDKDPSSSLLELEALSQQKDFFNFQYVDLRFSNRAYLQ